MPTTIKDIAREANVSIATVSKVLNNKMNVAAGTREKVLQTVKRLNYAPNASAANLARRSNQTIIYADSFHRGLPFENPHMFDIICGASHELSRKGYKLSLLNLDAASRSVSEILEETILSRSADGILINGQFVTPKIEQLVLQYDFPQICVGVPYFDSLLSWIDTNHALSSSIAVSHLLSRGHARIAFMGGQKKDHIFLDRLHGFQVAMERNGLPIPPEYVVYNAPDIDAIPRAAAQLLDLPVPPDSIICTNSLMAVGTIRAIQDRGLSFPQQIALVTFDDYPYTPMLSPRPTVIDIDLFSLGVHASNSLLKKIRNPAMLIQTYTALPKLIQRETT